MTNTTRSILEIIVCILVLALLIVAYTMHWVPVWVSVALSILAFVVGVFYFRVYRPRLMNGVQVKNLPKPKSFQELQRLLSQKEMTGAGRRRLSMPIRDRRM